MSENVVIMMIGISTILGAIGLGALIWAVRTGQFDDHSKFIDAVRNDNVEDLRDAAMMEKKRNMHKQRKKTEKKNYMPPD